MTESREQIIEAILQNLERLSDESRINVPYVSTGIHAHVRMMMRTTVGNRRFNILEKILYELRTEYLEDALRIAELWAVNVRYF